MDFLLFGLDTIRKVHAYYALRNDVRFQNLNMNYEYHWTYLFTAFSKVIWWTSYFGVC